MFKVLVSQSVKSGGEGEGEKGKKISFTFGNTFAANRPLASGYILTAYPFLDDPTDIS